MRAGWGGLAGSLALHGAGVVLALALGALQTPPPVAPALVVHTVTLVAGDPQAGEASIAGGQADDPRQAAVPPREPVASAPVRAVSNMAAPVVLSEKTLRPASRLQRERPAPKPRPRDEVPAARTAADAATRLSEARPGGGDPGGQPGKNQGRGQGEAEGRGGGPGLYEGVFGEGDGPRFARRVLPTYPAQARRLGKEGVVVLRLSLDETGRLQQVDVVQSAGQLFDDEAVQALKASSYHPAMREGRAVSCLATIRIRFSLTS